MSFNQSKNNRTHKYNIQCFQLFNKNLFTTPLQITAFSFLLDSSFSRICFSSFVLKFCSFFFLIVTNRDKKFVNFFLIRTNRKTKSCKTDCNNRYCNLKKAFNQHDFSNIKFFLFCYFTSFHSTTLNACLCLEKVSHTDLLFFELKNPAKSIT